MAGGLRPAQSGWFDIGLHEQASPRHDVIDHSTLVLGKFAEIGFEATGHPLHRMRAKRSRHIRPSSRSIPVTMMVVIPAAAVIPAVRHHDAAAQHHGDTGDQ
ncbi:hypothetical protein DIE19_16025 [Burkholderia sp. Bp9126]|nr:hypothetical protein DIE19_16025 [Burkholderia sp. Bp9126]